MRHRNRKLPLIDLLYVGALAFIPVLITFMIAYRFIASESIYTLSKGTMTTKSAKMSLKGWFWKTNDGWIPIGVNSEGGLKRWKFTATNDAVVECLKKNDKVILYYTDEVLMPFRFGNSHQVYKCESK